jgi:transcriptional regulator with XRE-family HTH domain
MASLGFMTNDALRLALAQRRMTPEALADAISVDPKTVSRWLLDAGRTPQPRHRWAVADALEVSEMALWPNAARVLHRTGPEREILAAYPSHAAVPDSVWRSLVNDASREITIVGYGSYWLTWQIPNLIKTLRAKAEAGCRIRVIMGDPKMELVGPEEQATGVPLTLSARVEQTKHLLQPLKDLIGVRQTGLGWGRSVYRGDDVALADWWIAGAPGTEFPVLHLTKRMDGGWFDAVAVKHVDALWELAVPVW